MTEQRPILLHEAAGVFAAIVAYRHEAELPEALVATLDEALDELVDACERLRAVIRFDDASGPL